MVAVYMRINIVNYEIKNISDMTEIYVRSLSTVIRFYAKYVESALRETLPIESEA